MSADNGIYVASFPIADSTEVQWRVIHAQAIDNVDYGSMAEQDASRWAYFGDAKTFSNKKDALTYAHDLEEEILNDDFCNILEYGVNCIEFEHPLIPHTEEQIKKILGF